MKNSLKKRIIQEYNDRLKKFGHDPRSLGWSKGRQPIRFKILTEIGDLNNCSILDIGCGFGDLYDFLKGQGLRINYTGYDINPNFIAIAKETHPDVHFEIKDIQENDVKESFDWIICSGLFEFNIPEVNTFVENMLRTMHKISKKGVAVDFISDYVDHKNPSAFHANPETVFSICKSISKRVSLRHDYMPYEFCIYLYKNDSIDEKNVFTEG